MTSLNTNHKRGAALLEIVIAAIIVGIIAVIGVRAYASFLNNQSMNAGVEHVIGILQRARNYTLASYGNTGTSGKNYGVRFDTNNETVILFESNSSCNIVAIVTGAEQMPGDINIVSTALSSNVVVFQQISGDAKSEASNACVSLNTGSDTILLQSRRGGNTKTIRILPLGVVQVE